MEPIVTPTQMRSIDQASTVAVDELIDRAGSAVARSAVSMMGGTYGRRVVVIVGPGNNGADGRVAAARLVQRGVGVSMVEAASMDPEAPSLRLLIDRADLVIDAAYGTGLRSEFVAPDPGATPVLAVDIASGIDGLTGSLRGRAMHATATVSFAALKPGHLLGSGPEYAGIIEVADIGLDIGLGGVGPDSSLGESNSNVALVTDHDAALAWPRRRVDAHKWNAAVWVIAGSPAMTGAPHLACGAAMRAGAGYVRLSIPGALPSRDGDIGPVEVVRVALPSSGWSQHLDDLGRVSAIVVGPGLGRVPSLVDDLSVLVDISGRTDISERTDSSGGTEWPPLVIDGDGLWALAALIGSNPRGVSFSDRSVVLTPHDGEFQQLTGRNPGPDRIAEAASLAAMLDVTVLLKGGPTVVAGPDGSVRVVTSGDARLATAGTGDVLSGVVGALLAQGLSPLDAGSIGAHVHGRAAALGPAHGFVASDLVDLVPEAVEAIMERPRPPRTLR